MIEGGAGTRRMLAATVAISTSTAMWEQGELTQAQYIDAVMVAQGIAGGTWPVLEGLRVLMGLWMVGVLPRRVEVVRAVPVRMLSDGPAAYPH